MRFQTESVRRASTQTDLCASLSSGSPRDPGSPSRPQLGAHLVALVWCLGLWTLGPWTPAVAVAPDIELTTVLEGLANPILVTSAEDHRLFVVLREGQILVVDDGVLQPQPLLDLRDRVLFENNMDGLYSLAFDPNHQRNGRFYVLYTALDAQTVISRFEVGADPDRGLPASEQVLLTIDQTEGGHDGNHLAFGPDGYLYASTGDSGPGRDPRCAAQTVDDLEGKILRLDVDRDTAPFAVPPSDNPFVGQGSAARWVWALGLRNPWRFSFDRSMGDLWIGDPGEDVREEVSFQPAGSPGGLNFGWKRLEGTLCLDDAEGCATPPPACDSPTYVAPRIEYDNTGSDCAVIGGFVYRGAHIPDLVGRYVHGDFCSGKLWAGRNLGGSWIQEVSEPTAPTLISLGEDAEGELHLVTATGLLQRIDPPPTAQPGVVELSLEEVFGREATGQAVVLVRRLGGTAGVAQVDYTTVAGSAGNQDFSPRSGTLTWADGDRSPRRIVVPILDDAEAEAEETLTIQLSNAQGAGLGTRTSAPVVVLDDDGSGNCVADATTLCLNQGRFRVRVDFRDFEGVPGEGQAETLTVDGGFFWFFDETNPEIFVKVFRACVDPFQSYWVFAAGLTDVETHLEVTDTLTGQTETWDKPLGEGFLPIRDTSSFDTCP